MSGYWLCGWDLDHTINNIIVKPCLAELLRIGQDITGLIDVKVCGGYVHYIEINTNLV
jgi:hypothetical protein